MDILIRKFGHYFGTEVERKWWRRYMESGFSFRGMGEFWFDKQALNFRRFKCDDTLRIEYDKMTHIKVGKWHLLRRANGASVVKIDWEEDGVTLCSGFVFSNEGLETVGVMQKLERYSKGLSQRPN